MMIIRPCSTCHLRKGCVRFDSIKCEVECAWIDLKRITAEFSCDWYDGLYSPGVRVSVHLHRYESGDPEYHDHEVLEEGDFTGTIIRRPKKRRVAVWMDDNDGLARTIITVPLGRLTFIAERPVDVCPLCGRPEGKKNRNTFVCDECDKDAA